MSKHLNPLEKEFLIRRYRSNQRISIKDFCKNNGITEASLKKWMKQYDEGGLEGLARADAQSKDVLPEGVDRAGYYKWKNREPSSRDNKREEIVALVKKVHGEHPTHGYRWTAAYLHINLGVAISENYAYKCYRYLGIKAETKHRVRYRPRKVKDLYPNLIFTTWDTVDRPRQVIVSDMTVFKMYCYYYEVTFYFDSFTKEILASKVAEQRGSRDQYIDGLAVVVNLLKGSAEPTVLHTNQGSVYASMAYNELIKDTNIVRSMSRAGKPTGNPVNEALNGWIKEELCVEFQIEQCWKTPDTFKQTI